MSIVEFKLTVNKGIDRFNTKLQKLQQNSQVPVSVWSSVNAILERHMLSNFQSNISKFGLADTTKGIKKALVTLGTLIPRGAGGNPSRKALKQYIDVYGKRTGFFQEQLSPGKYGLGSTEFMVRLLGSSTEGDSFLNWGVNLSSYFESYPRFIMQDNPLVVIGSRPGLVQFTEDQILDVMLKLVTKYFIPLISNAGGASN